MWNGSHRSTKLQGLMVNIYSQMLLFLHLVALNSTPSPLLSCCDCLTKIPLASHQHIVFSLWTENDLLDNAAVESK